MYSFFLQFRLIWWNICNLLLDSYFKKKTNWNLQGFYIQVWFLNYQIFFLVFIFEDENVKWCVSFLSDVWITQNYFFQNNIVFACMYSFNIFILVSILYEKYWKAWDVEVNRNLNHFSPGSEFRKAISVFCINRNP